MSLNPFQIGEQVCALSAWLTCDHAASDHVGLPLTTPGGIVHGKVSPTAVEGMRAARLSWRGSLKESSMKRMTLFALITTLAIIGSSCDEGNQPPSSPSQTQNTYTFNADLKAANENPPILAPDAEATASGFANITIVATRDASGAIASGTVDFFVTLTGFPQSTTISLAHIHIGAAGVNGGIRVNTDVASGQVPLTNGAATFTRTQKNVTGADLQAMLDNPAGWYFNVHSQLHGGGVIRGQLVRTQ
jgi:CHRD domain